MKRKKKPTKNDIFVPRDPLHALRRLVSGPQKAPCGGSGLYPLGFKCLWGPIEVSLTQVGRWSEKLGNLSKVTQLLSGEKGIQAGLESETSKPLLRR